MSDFSRVVSVLPLPDRQPPYAPEAEAAVLGAILTDSEALPKVLTVLDDAAFYREAHRRIFRAASKLFERGAVIDPITVAEELRKTDELDHIGGMAYLSDLMDAVPIGSVVEDHARIVRDRSLLRRTIEACSTTIRDCYEPGEQATDKILDAAQSRLFEVANGAVEGGLVWMKKDLISTFERIEELGKAKNGITGIPSGLIDLDNLTGGWQKSDLILVAGRPSMGKTSLALGFALHASISWQTPVAFFSLEQSREQLIMRALAYEAMVDLSRVMRGKLTDDDYVRLAQAAAHLNTAEIYIDDRGGQTVTQIRAKARRMKAEHPDLGLIIVDYIQLAEGEGENQNIKVGSISKGLKALAKELNVPVIALAQLSRAPEQRSDHRPQLSDLRDSGSLEQDADLVLFTHRPEYYLSANEAAEKGLQGRAELILGKQRNGPTGTVDAFFRKESTRFESYSRYDAAA